VSLYAVFEFLRRGPARRLPCPIQQERRFEVQLGDGAFRPRSPRHPLTPIGPCWRGTALGAQAVQTAASTLVTMGLVVASADLGLSIEDWLNLGFVKIARRKGFYVCDRTRKNRYGRAVL